MEPHFANTWAIRGGSHARGNVKFVELAILLAAVSVRDEDGSYA